MKHYNFLKKLVAGVMATIMVLSLGTVAFADTVATGSGVGVEDYQRANALDITAVNAISAPREGDDSITDYTITITYTGATSEDQVTVLAYIYAENDAELTAVPAASAIYAIDQEAGDGEAVIYLSTESELAEDGETELRKPVSGTETLIIKMGSDAAGISAAQAVRISLADLQPFEGLDVTEAPAAVEAVVSYGDSKYDLMGQLPDFVTVTGTRNGVADNATVDVVWNVDEAWVANNVNGMTVTGTLQATEDIRLNAYTSVTANVTVNPLTSADIVAPDAIEVAVDADAAAIARRIGTITVESGEITDTYAVTDANVSGFDTSAEGDTTATITISGKSANGIFDLAEMTTTVSITVVEAPAGVLGDMNGDEAVDSDDAIYLLFHTFDPEGMPLANNASGDVNSDGAVDSDDAIYLLFHTFDPEGMPLYPEV